jgi:hypothetical protein
MQETEHLIDEMKLTEVFITASGGIYQSDSESCWYVNFAGKLARFDYRCLLKLKKAVYHIDVDAILLKSGRSADIEIVFICACDHSYILSVMEIVRFKELLQGAFTMLELNHIIYDRLYRLAV